MTRESGTLLATILGSGIVLLDSTVVAVALPRVGRVLPSHYFGLLEGQSFVHTGCLLTESALVILAGAVIIPGSPGLDTSSQALRLQIAPLNPPAPAPPTALRPAAAAASTEAFHRAMLAAAALLAIGAVTNAVGMRTASLETARIVSPDPQWRRQCHLTGASEDAPRPAARAGAARTRARS